MLTSVTPLRATAETLIVPTDYRTIQAAVNAARVGDDVLVEPGRYSENIRLRSGINIAGREAARTWLEPASRTAPAVSIVGSTDIRISNLTLIGAVNGIEVIGSTGITVANLVFDTVTDIAIAVDFVSDVDILNNVFFGSSVAVFRSTGNATVTNNIFRRNNVTIASPNNLIDNNFNVDSNCWSANADLVVGGIDRSWGSNAVTGDPLFVDTGIRDFHLRQNSPCIDIGAGTDIIDNTVADAGAYGGQFADAYPFPVGEPLLSDSSTDNPAVTNITASWQANGSYLVTNTVAPGGYRIHYRQNASGPPYDGTDAGGGTIASPVLAGDVTEFTIENLQPDPPALIAPELVSADGINAGVVLSWNPVADASGYRVHYGVDSIGENELDTGNVTTYTVTGLNNGTTYRFAVSALSQAQYFVAITAFDSTAVQNESDFSAEVSLRAGPVRQSNESTEFTALPQLILPYPPLRDEGGCFIATAAFGADWEREVMILRRFRDEILLSNLAGRWLVAQYYHISPAIADRLRDMPRMRAVVRGALMPAVGVAWLMTEAGFWTKTAAALLLMATAGLVACRRFRRPDGHAAATV